MSALTRQDATRTASRIAAGTLSASEAVAACLAEIARVDPALGAFVDVRGDDARAEARAFDEAAARGAPARPLGGVPVTVKSAIEVSGLRCEVGSPSRRGLRATGDAVVVRRLRAAGAIVLGTTNVAEMLMAYETVNPLHGTTRNPWDHTRTPGGSSGGEAAAIAAGCSFAGIGSDGGGSIRVPAHFTGICGLKPTPGRIPATGHQPACLGPFSLIGAVGPMARSVADLRLLLDVLAGWDADDPCAGPISLGALAYPAAREVWWFDDDERAPATPATRAAVAAAVAALAAAGYRVRHQRPRALDAAAALWDIFFGDAGEMLLATAIGEGARTLPILAAMHRERGPRPELTAAGLAAAWAARDALRAAFIHQVEGRVIVCPVTAIPAFAHGERRWHVEGREVGYLDAMIYTQWFNLLGAPAAVVPAGRSPEGLPIGVQVVGSPFMEGAVLDAAEVIERHGGGYVAPPSAGAP